MELISETYKVTCPYCKFVTRVTVKPNEYSVVPPADEVNTRYDQHIVYSSYYCANCSREVILPYHIYYIGLSSYEHHIKNELIEISHKINKLCELLWSDKK